MYLHVHKCLCLHVHKINVCVYGSLISTSHFSLMGYFLQLQQIAGTCRIQDIVYYSFYTLKTQYNNYMHVDYEVLLDLYTSPLYNSCLYSPVQSLKFIRLLYYLDTKRWSLTHPVSTSEISKCCWVLDEFASFGFVPTLVDSGQLQPLFVIFNHHSLRIQLSTAFLFRK